MTDNFEPEPYNPCDDCIHKNNFSKCQKCKHRRRTPIPYNPIPQRRPPYTQIQKNSDEVIKYTNANELVKDMRKGLLKGRIVWLVERGTQKEQGK